VLAERRSEPDNSLQLLFKSTESILPPHYNGDVSEENTKPEFSARCVAEWFSRFVDDYPDFEHVPINVVVIEQGMDAPLRHLIAALSTILLVYHPAAHIITVHPRTVKSYWGLECLGHDVNKMLAIKKVYSLWPHLQQVDMDSHQSDALLTGLYYFGLSARTTRIFIAGVEEIVPAQPSSSSSISATFLANSAKKCRGSVKVIPPQEEEVVAMAVAEEGVDTDRTDQKSRAGSSQKTRRSATTAKTTRPKSESLGPVKTKAVKRGRVKAVLRTSTSQDQQSLNNSTNSKITSLAEFLERGMEAKDEEVVECTTTTHKRKNKKALLHASGLVSLMRITMTPRPKDTTLLQLPPLAPCQ